MSDPSDWGSCSSNSNVYIDNKFLRARYGVFYSRGNGTPEYWRETDSIRRAEMEIDGLIARMSRLYDIAGFIEDRQTNELISYPKGKQCV